VGRLSSFALWFDTGRIRSTVWTAFQRPHQAIGQKVRVNQVSDKIWLVSFMEYDLGYFDHQTCRLEPVENPFAAKVFPMSPV